MDTTKIYSLIGLPCSQKLYSWPKKVIKHSLWAKPSKLDSRSELIHKTSKEKVYEQSNLTQFGVKMNSCEKVYESQRGCVSHDQNELMRIRYQCLQAELSVQYNKHKLHQNIGLWAEERSPVLQFKWTYTSLKRKFTNLCNSK